MVKNHGEQNKEWKKRITFSFHWVYTRRRRRRGEEKQHRPRLEQHTQKLCKAETSKERKKENFFYEINNHFHILIRATFLLKDGNIHLPKIKQNLKERMWSEV